MDAGTIPIETKSEQQANVVADTNTIKVVVEAPKSEAGCDEQQTPEECPTKSEQQANVVADIDAKEAKSEQSAEVVVEAPKSEAGQDEQKTPEGCLTKFKQKVFETCNSSKSMIQKALFYRYVFTPWLTILDIVTDIMALVQYQIVVALYTIMTIAGSGANRDGNDDSTFDLSMVAAAYVPLIPLLFVICANAYYEASAIFFGFIICYEPVLMILSLFAPLYICYTTIFHVWLPWMRFLFCGWDEPELCLTNEWVEGNGPSHRTTRVITPSGAAVVLADWETILESFPQSVVGVIVFALYLDQSSHYEVMVIGISTIISFCKLLYTCSGVIKNRGHSF